MNTEVKWIKSRKELTKDNIDMQLKNNHSNGSYSKLKVRKGKSSHSKASAIHKVEEKENKSG